LSGVGFFLTKQTHNQIVFWRASNNHKHIVTR